MVEERKSTYPPTADGYRLTKEVGKGAFGTVFAAKVLTGDNEGKMVAIKEMELDDEYGSEKEWAVIEKEINVMRLLDHPNVIQSYISFVYDTTLWLVMPLMNAGSCAYVMKQRFPDGFDDEKLIATICAETLKGLQYLHEDDRIHRDVKAGNILLSTAGNVRLADYGVAGCLMDAGQKQSATKTFTGTPAWMAPEVMEQGQDGHNQKADIWSFGITALELGYGKPPYAKHAPMKILMLTLQQDPPSTHSYGEGSDKKFSSGFKSFVDKCLKKEVKDRPTARELFKHKFLKKAVGPEYIAEVLFKDQAPIDTIDSNGANGAVPVGARERNAPAANGNTGKPSRKPISVEAFDFTSDDTQATSQPSRFAVTYEDQES